MLIQDSQYIENVDCANEVNGSRSFEPRLRGQTGGNFGIATANSYVFGENTYSESRARVDIVQGVSSISSSYATGLAITYCC